jgi:hypothetical protein
MPVVSRRWTPYEKNGAPDYDVRGAAGDWKHQAQRHLFNRFLGQLHHCLQTGQHYNEHRAFPPPLPLAA